ncbi:MAG: LamG domain-containing protein, partial [Sedimentisphaerales bacterium]|nr:LamG domain-containing protein [Sedimentisphaerales bacterium]
DEGAGNIAYDASGNGYHGVLYGDPQWQPERLVLDGIDDYVKLPIGSLISSLNECTITAHVNWSAQGDIWQRIFDFGTDTTNCIYLTPNTPFLGPFLEWPIRPSAETVPLSFEGPMQVSITAGPELRTDLATSTGVYGGWQDVAVVLKPDELRLYRYGRIEGSVSPSCVLSDLGETTNNWLGRSQYPEHPYFDGAFDDVRIYNRALSQDEIAELYGVVGPGDDLYKIQ